MADATEISLPNYDLTGKVALVTGATSGLGLPFFPDSGKGRREELRSPGAASTGSKR